MPDQPHQPDEWLSVDDVAATLKMDPETVRRWIRTKQLKAYKFGRDLRIKRTDFEAFIEQRALDDH